MDTTRQSTDRPITGHIDHHVVVTSAVTTKAADDSNLQQEGSGSVPLSEKALKTGWARVLKRLKASVGKEVFSSWFARMELGAISGQTVHLSVPHRFLKSWIQSHYSDELLKCLSSEFDSAKSISITVRSPGGAPTQRSEPETAQRTHAMEAGASTERSGMTAPAIEFAQSQGQTECGGFQGSPLDPRLTFDSFVIGASNRLSHAAAKQVAETILDKPLRFNPLYIHSSVGLGKTHLLHAIAWDVKRRNPSSKVLYLTAERFRYRFVEALRSKDAMSFKEQLRGIDILLIDDMEFLHGERTEQEFDHTLNSLLDGGKQVIVASARAPSQLDTLDPRMRSRLSGGLVTELSTLDYDLRRRILERRAEEKRAADPTFQITRDVIEFLAERLNESARELDGAVTRLYAACHLTGTPITVDSAEYIVRDLMRGLEPKRIKIDDILKLVSKHFGVSRNDILSQRRHRSIVWPRQIGMYLSKQMTSRSLPEIGRRFGGRDHTTVLHAVRKVEGELQSDTRLKEEIEDLKRLLNN